MCRYFELARAEPYTEEHALGDLDRKYFLRVTHATLKASTSM
jgi:hypothetical protein